MTHFMHLKEEPFRKIQKGVKTIELRLYDEKRRKLNVGDQIEFECFPDHFQKIVAKVTALHLFGTFDQLYETLPLEKCGYDLHELSSASAADMNLYYSLEEQAEYGVVGIEFEIV